MRKIYLLTLLSFLALTSIQAQVVFSEDFEGGSIPADWTNMSNASDGGWKVGAPASLSSQFFGIETNGSSNVAATNDDDCNCDKADEYFITPAIDLAGQTNLILTFDAFYLDNAYQGSQEAASVDISTDGGTTWETLLDMPGEGDWVMYAIDLSEWADETVNIGFRYDDNGGWLYGFALDNIKIQVPPTLEMALSSINERAFGEINTAQKIGGQVYNAGVTTVESITVGFEVTDGTEETETIENLSIAPLSYYDFELMADWTPSSAGTFEVMVEIKEVNGEADENQVNNLAFYSSEIYDEVIVPNKIPEFLVSNLDVTELTGANNLLEGPNDLAFFPILGRDELWVLNQRTESAGGSTITISDATDETPSNFNRLVDGNAWHFMSLPTAIDFSDDNFNFATSPGVQDANHGGGTFTGPSLWSSDLAIYAQPSGGNGSHLDMLHGSPFSMGIAHEVGNVFWVYDDWNNDMVRYDFVEDHGPGNDDHSDAIVRRYQDIGIQSISNIPNHMKVDKSTGWLYFVDNGNNRVMRLDVNSGAVGGNVPLINEPLAEHSRVDNFMAEEIISEGLDQACGLEIFENYLMIGDFATGDIYVYDMDDNFNKLGTIATGNPGLTGITVGPDGNIWYTNRTDNTLNSAAPGSPSSTQQVERSLNVRVAPNPSHGPVTITLGEEATQAPLTLSITNAAGKTIYTVDQLANSHEMDLSDFPNGVYLLTFQNEEIIHTRKMVLNK